MYVLVTHSKPCFSCTGFVPEVEIAFAGGLCFSIPYDCRVCTGQVVLVFECVAASAGFSDVQTEFFAVRFVFRHDFLVSSVAAFQGS